MKNALSRTRVVALAACLGFATGTANAIPVLQLGIAGGTYDWSTQTIVATSSSFSLFAFLDPNSSNTLSDTYYLSMAITPQVSTPADLGSFTYNGTTVNVTSGMDYGVPPIDAYSAGADSGDLPTHGIYPTYYKEVGFSFNSSINPSAGVSAKFDTQLNPGSGPQAGSGMYYASFDIDTTNLADGYAIHFDLYNTTLCTRNKASCAGQTDTDITKFAPFSHDAQSRSSVPPPPPPAVPEPETYALLLAGLGLLGFNTLRKKQDS